jgi:hypothetical protein
MGWTVPRMRISIGSHYLMEDGWCCARTLGSGGCRLHMHARYKVRAWHAYGILTDGMDSAAHAHKHWVPLPNGGWMVLRMRTR